VADGNAQEVPVKVRSGAAAEPSGGSSGRAHIKLSSLVSDLPGASARRMLNALADGETKPAALATLADQKLRATSEQLCDALGACTELKPVYRRLLRMALEQQIGQLDQELATLLHPHQDAVQRLAEVPGLGVDSAQL
jgi:transposase